MPWDLENLNPSKRFYFDESQLNDGESWEDREWIELRVAARDDLQGFFTKLGVKEKVEWKVNPETRALQRVSYLNVSDTVQEKFNEELWDFSITAWNLVTNNGETIPCTRENKAVMMRRSVTFANRVEEWLKQVREAAIGDQIQDAVRKN